MCRPHAQARHIQCRWFLFGLQKVADNFFLCSKLLVLFFRNITRLVQVDAGYRGARGRLCVKDPAPAMVPRHRCLAISICVVIVSALAEAKVAEAKVAEAKAGEEGVAKSFLHAATRGEGWDSCVVF